MTDSEYEGWHGKYTQAVIDLHDAVAAELIRRDHKARITYCFATLPTLEIEAGEYGVEVWHHLRWTEGSPATELPNFDGEMVTHDEIPPRLVVDWSLDNWTNHVHCEDHSIEIKVQICAYFDKPFTYHADSIERLLKYADWLEISEKVE